MKAYTDLEQSKKLAELLPPESADMYYYYTEEELTLKGSLEVYHVHIPFNKANYEWYKSTKDSYTPCWSLAALLDILPNEISTGENFWDKYQIHIRKYNDGENSTLHQIAYGNDRGFSGSWHDMINTGEKEDLIDCCYQMILNLNKLNLLQL
jgi:hypothetical protein